MNINMNENSGETGYASEQYAKGFSDFGRVISLPRSKGWVLERPIPGTSLLDGMGLYPLFACKHWDLLGEDLAELSSRLVSIAMVPDPFGHYNVPLLENIFTIVRPFKTRYFVRLGELPETYVSKHHRKQARRAMRELEIEAVCPMNHLEEWVSLYAKTCSRLGISGIQRFSAESFSAQLSTPGMIMFRACHQGQTVAMHLWVTSGEYGYGHLAAHDDAAYSLGAAYALYWEALQWFTPKLKYLDLGAAAGSESSGHSGLDFFKRGWSNDLKQGIFCGKVLQHDVYEGLSRRSNGVPVEQKVSQDFFPVYRSASWLRNKIVVGD